MAKLTHLDDSGNPMMVDISEKGETTRTALAQATMIFPEKAAKTLQDAQNNTKKGSVFTIAEIAGIMGAKKTSELIPLCHPLLTEKIIISIKWSTDTLLTLNCEVKISGKTGVEMEALTGVSIAALTVYDMCKALSPDIVISEIHLLSKTGGKSNYKREKN
jgi:cyclic pyranopterin monophosphate synthase